ncbi:hypothetical protein EWM64_g1384 [Hericium alpestre]|uniref:Uncharacterized protein n=1 Tax=Hericium alpestre TaxID=135208 RepID=A0A4Z0A7B6_9AGAM|nr:hypothetical protein EWM64_g1384 [Hericium alpestre]
MKKMIIAATVLAAVPVVLAVFMPNWYLGDKQNAVEDIVEVVEPSHNEKDKDAVSAA